MDKYEDIFNQRGDAYHKAMELYPNARTQEFKSAIELVDLQKGDRLLDLPAGGGYLKNFLPEGIHYQGMDFSTRFGHQAEIGKCTEQLIPLSDKQVDHVVSLAALHHIEDRESFYTECHRILKDAGVLLIGDVLANHQIASFLNGFVNEWNSMGHDGNFLDLQHETSLLAKIGFEVSSTIKNYPWTFSSKEDALLFFRLLFGLDKSPSDEGLLLELGKLGGLVKKSSFQISWSLGFLVCKKR